MADPITAIISLVATIIGIVASTAGLASSGMGLAKMSKVDMPQTPNTHVRIAVGLDNHLNVTNPVAGAGGPPPMLYVYDENKDFIGWTKHKPHKRIESGGHYDMTVRHGVHRGGRQATYLQVMPEENALCIAYITAAWSDGSSHAWVGTNAAACGYHFGFSNVHFGLAKMKPSPDENYKDYSNNTEDYCKMPKMLYMDEYDKELYKNIGHPYGMTQGTIWEAQVKAPVYNPTPSYRVGKSPGDDSGLMGDGDGDGDDVPGNTGADESGPNALCRIDSNMRHGCQGPHPTPALGPRPPSTITRRNPDHERRALHRRQALIRRTRPHLITSADYAHSAKVACLHSGYIGPDVVSEHEGLFCDTHHEGRTLWPLCRKSSEEKGVDDECFNVERRSLVSGGEHYVRTYKRDEIWEEDGTIKAR